MGNADEKTFDDVLRIQHSICSNLFAFSLFLLHSPILAMLHGNFRVSPPVHGGCEARSFYFAQPFLLKRATSGGVTPKVFCSTADRLRASLYRLGQRTTSRFSLK